MLQYATADELGDHSPSLDPPDDVDRMLRSASLLVTHAVRFARYTTQPSGLPADAELVEALRDATCEQVTAWVRAGVDPALGVITDSSSGGDLKSSTVTAGPRTVTEQYTDATSSSSEVTPSTVELTPQAWLILHHAGLTGVYVQATRGWG